MNRAVILAASIAAAAVQLSPRARADLAWDARYEGNVLPTTPGSVLFSDGSTSEFYTSYNPVLSTDGNVANFASTGGYAGIIRLDSKQPYPASTLWKLDSTIGYTSEWRARLNSTDVAGEYATAGVYLSEPVAGNNAFILGMSDVNGAEPGYSIRLSGGGSAPAVGVSDGWHVFRMTVLGTTAKVYVDGVLATSLDGGGTSAQEIRAGDFNGMAYTNWDMDYWYVYDGGAVVPVVGDNQWAVDGTASWLAPGSWSGNTVPNGVGAEANFLGTITAPRTVVADSPVTVGTLKFDNANGYQLAGQGSLTIQTSTGNGSVSVLQGGHKINLPLFFASNTDVTVASGATLTIGNPTTIKAGKTVTKSGSVLIQAPLTLEAGASLVLASGPTTAFMAPSLDAGAQIDLKNNSMTIDYRGQATPAATIRSQIASGGIMTSSAVANQTTLGWKDTAASSSILVKYTYYGDANLDGQVDISDLGALATAWQTSAVWSQGDFDYSGFVDISDLGKLATNWQLGVGSPLGPSFDEALASVGLAGVSVPEPASMGLIGLALLGLTSMRQRVRRR